jgi:TonB family protein
MKAHEWLAGWSAWVWPLLGNHLWQATLVLMIALIAASFLKNAPGRARYILWVVASAKLAVPSVLVVLLLQRLGVDFSRLFSSPKKGFTDGAAIISQLASPITLSDGFPTSIAAPKHNEILCVLSLAWLMGSTLLLTIWLARRYRFRTTMRAVSIEDSTRERLALERVRTWLSVKRDVRLSVLRGNVEPGVWGVFKPRVFLPENMADQLSDAELEAVMMHEMVHVARWDNLVANFHRFVCCILWFHPLVWILDRLLLADRERACDEEVIRLGGAPAVYASSLLKVLRFCLGWSLAGASNATGSNLGRRVERIMTDSSGIRISKWHRIAVGSIATIVILISIAAGVLTRDGVIAQESGPQHGGVPGGVPGGIPGGTIGGVTGGIPGGVPGGVPGGIASELMSAQQQASILERLSQASEVNLQFKNAADSPLTINDARVKAVPLEANGPGDESAVIPIVSVTNNTNRKIRGLMLEFRNQLERRAYFEPCQPMIQPQSTYVSGGQKRFFILVGTPDGWSARIGGVLYEDGEVWGRVPPPPPPPPPVAVSKELLAQLEQGAEVPIQIERNEAPISITSASLKTLKQPNDSGDGVNHYVMMEVYELLNNTAKVVNGVGLDVMDGDSGNKSYAETSRISIQPGASFTFRRFRTGLSVLIDRSADSRTTIIQRSSGAGFSERHIRVAVAGVSFEDGETWGKKVFGPPAPPPPPEIADPNDPSFRIRKSGGVFSESATRRVEPTMPPLARAANISGSVVVEVTVDESGAVIAARVISGHPLLKAAAVDAARQWQFTPTMLSGTPVKVVGTITFNFNN